MRLIEQVDHALGMAAKSEEIVFAAHHAEKIKQHYTRPEVAAGYGAQRYITPCERLLLDTYIKPGMAILDVGVGGGRTSEFLARDASRYVGIDYAAEMIETCRSKYPQWEYFVDSATDLSRFQCGSFDAVVMSYNTLDDVIFDSDRWRCLKECHRVLRNRGLFVFSSHNPRAIFVRPHWQRRRDDAYRQVASQQGNGRVSHALEAATRVRTFFSAVNLSSRRIMRWLWRVPFWRGEGHMLDAGNFMTHFWVPKKAIRELTRAGFQFETMQGDDYPLKSHIWTTEWYYYVFSKAG
jgi:ubiquinone/menaquinone biosynthesis C-methylase UbiE